MLEKIEKPKTYVYKRYEDNNISIPTLPKEFEDRNIIVYADKCYSFDEVAKNEAFNYECDYNEACYDTIPNFQELIKNLKRGDYVCLEKFADIAWDWYILINVLSKFKEKGITFSCYDIYFKNCEDVITILQLGKTLCLPFEETHILHLLYFYKFYHEEQERLRNIQKMKQYDLETGEIV